MQAVSQDISTLHPRAVRSPNRCAGAAATPQTYGHDLMNADTWDARLLQGCVCDAPTRTYPLGVGNVPTYFGYNCDQRADAQGARGRLLLLTARCQLHRVARPPRAGTCMTGDPPEALGTKEVQRLTCTLASGTFTLAFRGDTTDAIDAAATIDQLRDAIKQMTTCVRWRARAKPRRARWPGGVGPPSRWAEHPRIARDSASLGPSRVAAPTVRFQHRRGVGGLRQRLCDPGGCAGVRRCGLRCVRGAPAGTRWRPSSPHLLALPLAIHITFETEQGNLPLLAASHADVVVQQVVAGTSADLECAGNGVCGSCAFNASASSCNAPLAPLESDRTQGVCSCFSGFRSSDGRGGVGQRGDCGAVDVLAETSIRARNPPYARPSLLNP